MNTDIHHDIDLKFLNREAGFHSIRRSSLPNVRPMQLRDCHNLLKGSDNLQLDKLLEYCDDIRPVLAAMRSALISGKKIALTAGYNDGFWQWDAPSLASVLAAAGIEAAAIKDEADGLFTFTLACSKKSYESFLAAQHLPNPEIQHLIITTEHADYRVTGGIGSYVKECDVLYGDAVGVVILDNNQDVDLGKINRNRWIAAQQFVSLRRIATIDAANFDTLGDLAYEVLESLLCLYPRLESVESQEMLLHRTIEAKKIGLIPQDMKLITMCHGSSFHLAKAKRSVIDAENIHVAYREKFTIEESDCVIFPTRFLQKSYQESGISVRDDASRIIKRLPFDYSRLPKGKQLKDYRRIIYIGKTSTIKGFDLFLETLFEIEDKFPAIKDRIEEVVVMATTTKIEEPRLQDMFRRAEASYNLRMASLNREELLMTLANYSEDSLALVTYRGDNHPLAILELMGVGHDFLAANAAGTPELILPGTEKNYLVQADAPAFAAAVNAAFKHVGKRSREIRKAFDEYRRQQQIINEGYSIDQLRAIPALPMPSRQQLDGIRVDIVRGVANDAALKATRQSLELQSHAPASIRVVEDDTESEDRKSGLYMRLYAGDLLHATALEHMVRLLNSDDITGGVMAYEDVPVYNGERLKGQEEFHPFSPELGSVFLQEKYSRRVVALLKNPVLDNSFTDWQKLINISCSGQAIRIVPMKLATLVTTPSYPDTDLLHVQHQFARSYACLPVFDATILYSELKRFDDIYWGVQLMNHMHARYIRRDDPSISYNVSPTAIRLTDMYRRVLPLPLRKGLYTSLKATYRVMRKITRR